MSLSCGPDACYKGDKQQCNCDIQVIFLYLQNRKHTSHARKNEFCLCFSGCVGGAVMFFNLTYSEIYVTNRRRCFSAYCLTALCF